MSVLCVFSDLTFAPCHRDVQSRILQRVYNRSTAEEVNLTSFINRTGCNRTPILLIFQQRWIVRIILKGEFFNRALHGAHGCARYDCVRQRDYRVFGIPPRCARSIQHMFRSQEGGLGALGPV
jgi:hypothetical protein